MVGVPRFVAVALGVIFCCLRPLNCHDHHDQYGVALLVVSFDGLGEEIVRNNQHLLPNIARAKKEGATVERMTGVFPSITAVNHYAIATGTYPETNGVVLNYLYDPELGKQLTKLDSGGEFWNFNNEVTPVWLLNERSGPGRYSGSVMWPGAEHTIQNSKPTYVTKGNASVDWRHRIDTALEWITDANKPANVVLAYIDEPDEILHKYGPNAPELSPVLQKVDDLVGYVMERLKTPELENRVNVMFTSDHGHAECVQSKHTINMTDIIPPGIKYITIGKAAVRHIFTHNESDTVKIYEALLAGSKRHNYSVYRRQDIPDHWHYKNNRRIASIIVVADEPYVFQDAGRKFRERDVSLNRTLSDDNTHGCHGYNQTNPAMLPFFVAYGPAFRKDYIGKPILNVDLYPLMCDLLGVKPGPNNGSLEATRELLLNDDGDNTEESQDYWLFGISMILILLTVAVLIYAIIMCIRKKQEERAGLQIVRKPPVQYEPCATTENGAS